MDQYGPEKLFQAYDPLKKTLGLLVVDNTALGPGLGAIYPQKRVSIEHASELARFHTLMNSLHGVPFGGACACILIGEDWKADLNGFGEAVAPFANSSFIACPSEEMSQEEMQSYAYASDDVRGAVGKPPSLKGIPFENGAVGLGIAYCVLQTINSLNIEKPRASVHGLGRDGLFAARVLERNGITIVAAADSESATINRDGLQIGPLERMVKAGGRVDAYSRGNGASMEQALAEPVDVMVIAGRGLFSKMIANSISPRILVEAAPGAVGKDACSLLEARGVCVIPDILACGGLCLSAHIEHIGGNVVDMNEIVMNSMKRLTAKALEESGKSIREWAERTALERIDKAMEKKKLKKNQF